jgi:hypothetical protein
VRLPVWLTLTCAAIVILWGCYRILLGLRRGPEAERGPTSRGLFALPRRTHVLIGIVYLILGGGLVAVTLGWNPLRPSPARTAPADPIPPGAAIEVDRP